MAHIFAKLILRLSKGKNAFKALFKGLINYFLELELRKTKL